MRIFSVVILLSFTLYKPVVADKSVGYVSVVKEERMNVDCQSKDFPSWLDGYFLKQSCGAIGSLDGAIGERVTHMFDCLGMVANFKLSGGNAKYSNKYYRNRAYQSFEKNEKDFKKTKVSWGTYYTQPDTTAAKELAAQTSTLAAINPNQNFWKIGQKLEAVTEVYSGYSFDIDTLFMNGMFKFGDSSLGLNETTMFLASPAHEQTESDGTLWSTCIAVMPKTDKIFEAYRIIYKIAPGSTTRTVVGKLKLRDVNLNNCQTNGDSVKYIDVASRNEWGYMHSFAMTKRYIVLPVTSYLINPCFIGASTEMSLKPFFSTWLNFEPLSPFRFLIMEKSSGNFWKEIFEVNGSPLFVTHQVNAYEEGDRIIADMLTYKNANPFTTYQQIDNLVKKLESWPMEGTLMRYMMESGKGSTGNILTSKAVVSGEYPQINHNFNAQDYKYLYLLENPNFDQSFVRKYNVKNKTDLSIWNPGENIYPGEPIFVPKPGGTAEDDGILLISVVDSNTKKGGVYAVDAKTMKTIGYTIAPDMVPFGQHSRYYTAKELGKSNSASKLTALLPTIFTFLCVLILSCN